MARVLATIDVNQADGPPALARNLYCLQCGYNLRGLSGDPIRCPECGYDNDLGTVMIPAGVIRAALHGMETYPSYCVMMSLGLASMPLLLIFGDAPTRAVGLLGLIVFTLVWIACYRGTCDCFRNRLLRRRVMVDFHVIVLICVSPFLMPLAMHLTDFSPRSPGAVIAIVFISLFVCWVWGLRMYAASRKRLATGQREAAVVIAQATLSRALGQPSGRLRRATLREAGKE